MFALISANCYKTVTCSTCWSPQMSTTPEKFTFLFPSTLAIILATKRIIFILSTGTGRIKTSWLKTWRELRLRTISPTRSYPLLHPLGLLKTSMRNDTRSEVISSRRHWLDKSFLFSYTFFSHRINKHPSKLYTLKSLPVVFIGLIRVSGADHIMGHKEHSRKRSFPECPLPHVTWLAPDAYWYVK